MLIAVGPKERAAIRTSSRPRIISDAVTTPGNNVAPTVGNRRDEPCRGGSVCTVSTGSTRAPEPICQHEGKRWSRACGVWRNRPVRELRLVPNRQERLHERQSGFTQAIEPAANVSLNEIPKWK